MEKQPNSGHLRPGDNVVSNQEKELPLERVVEGLESTQKVIEEVALIDELVPKFGNFRDFAGSELTKETDVLTLGFFHSHLARTLVDVGLVQSAHERVRAIEASDKIKAYLYIATVEKSMGIDPTGTIQEVKDWAFGSIYKEDKDKFEDTAGRVAGVCDIAKFEEQLGSDPKPTIDRIRAFAVKGGSYMLGELVSIIKTEISLNLSIEETVKAFMDIVDSSERESFFKNYFPELYADMCNEEVVDEYGFQGLEETEFVELFKKFIKPDLGIDTSSHAGNLHSSIYEDLALLVNKDDFITEANKAVDSLEMAKLDKARGYLDVIELLKDKALTPEEIALLLKDEKLVGAIKENDLALVIDKLKSEIGSGLK